MIFVRFFIFSIGVVGIYSAGESCTNPENKEGNCIRFKDCPNLYKFFTNKPISQENRKFIRESQCGYLNGIFYVCCVQDDELAVTDKPGETTATAPREFEPEWLRILKEKMPQPPNCGNDAQLYLFGGPQAQIVEFPWSVLLEYNKPNNKKGFHCGGSLINERYVVTAAHCIKKIASDWRLVRVRIGEWKISTNPDCEYESCAPQSIDNNIVETIVHPLYRKHSRDQLYDIALLRLAKKLKFNDFVQPICLPLDPSLMQKDYTGHTFDVAGWGKTENAIASDVKLKDSVPFWTHENCTETYRGKRKIDETQICAGGVEGHSCIGDSGGPLMSYKSDSVPFYWYLAGVSSSNCDTDKLPQVFTNVTSNLQWIAENIRD